ncbi:Uncharacterised protein [Moraxella veridica]|nr:Uncharacterised protein [Moraxella catarrhalis]
MVELEILMSELTSNLLKPQNINLTNKPGVRSIGYTYLNLISYQRSVPIKIFTKPISAVVMTIKNQTPPNPSQLLPHYRMALVCIQLPHRPIKPHKPQFIPKINLK